MKNSATKSAAEAHKNAMEYILHTAGVDELSAIILAVKEKQKRLARSAKHSFVRGSTVKFTSTNNGTTYIGKITSIRTTRCTVSCTEPYPVVFTVPLSMLKAA